MRTVNAGMDRFIGYISDKNCTFMALATFIKD